MPSASVDIVASPECIRMNITAKTPVVGTIATWKILYLTSARSAAGKWVSGSPIMKCAGDIYVGLKGSSDKAHRGLEFRQSSISASSVHSSSLVAI